MSDNQSLPPVMLRGPQGDRMLLALGQRERGTLGALLASGKIGGAELLAANRWYEAYAMAEHGVFDADRTGTGSAVKLFAQERQVAAVTSARLARRALGEAGTRRLVAILSEGLSIKALATRLAAAAINRAGGPAPRMDPMFTCGLVVADLQRLVEHYAKGGSGKPSRA